MGRAKETGYVKVSWYLGLDLDIRILAEKTREN